MVLILNAADSLLRTAIKESGTIGLIIARIVKSGVPEGAQVHGCSGQKIGYGFNFAEPVSSAYR